jgi:hypothetical protein
VIDGIRVDGMEEWNYREFMSQVEEPDEYGCRNWNGKRRADGYGLFYAGGRTWCVHRWLMVYLNGGVNPGRRLFVRHMCWEFGVWPVNKLCVATEHLRWGTAKDNVQDALDSYSHVSQMITPCQTAD